MMILKGGRNLATGLRNVTVRASHSQESTHVWGRANLIDGHSPIGTPLGETFPEGTALGQCWHSASVKDARTTKWVQVDLGTTQAFDEVRLVPARMLAQSRHYGYGFPLRFRIEADDDPGYSQPELLADYTGEPFVNPGFNVVTIPGGATRRFVRVTATELFRRNRGDHAFALAELQVYAGDRNLASGAPVSYLDSRATEVTWHPRFLTDGARWEHQLGEWPEWLRGLSRRRELLAQLASVQGELVPLHRTLTRVVTWTAAALAIALALAVIAAFYRLQLRRVREADALRRRIASDLHDDLGSNLASIAILSEICLEQRDAPPRADLEEIRTLARDTAESLRDVAWLVRPGPRNSEELRERLRATARRLLAGHTWTFECEGLAGPLSLPFERHVLLALKEMLHNVVRHAAAAEVRIQLTAARERFALRVSDDGRGFEPAKVAAGEGLASLRHRAQMLGGEVRFESGAASGTTVTLTGRVERPSRSLLPLHE
jgi:signal transduction histidine kinase